MRVFDQIADRGHEQVAFCHHRPTGLRAIIAIHSTRLGPALGGTRFFPYPSEEDALGDVLRLAEVMTYKAAAAGLDLGGGKAVVIGDPAVDKTEALVRAYARFVGSLGGRYVTAEDVGTTQDDMDLIRRETRHVTGVSPSLGGSGDPSPATAYGVLHAMKAVAGHLWGSTSLRGRHVVISGVGKVGSSLGRHLVDEGARISVSDVDPLALGRAVGELGAEVVPVEKAHATDCDIFSPCAMGGALDATTIPELRCEAVVGGANNQLAERSGARLLDEVGVLYAPDYIVNAGGVINVAEELRGYDERRARAAVRRIEATTRAVLSEAAAEGILPTEAAARRAERRMDELAGVQLIRPSAHTGDGA